MDEATPRTFGRLVGVIKPIALLLVVAGSGCSPMPNGQSSSPALSNTQEVAPPAQLTTPSDLVDNTASMPSGASTASKQVVELLRTAIKPALLSRNADQLAQAIGSNFQFRYPLIQGTVRIFDRSAFLHLVQQGAVQGAGPTTIDYHIDKIVLSKDGNSVIVSSWTTYGYGYFRPIFLDTMLFEKQSGKWALARDALLPVFPRAPSDYGVQIYLLHTPLAKTEELLAPIHATFLLGGARQTVSEALQSGDQSAIKGDESGYSLVLIFGRSPAPGTAVRVEHQFARPTMGPLEPWRFEYQVPSTSPFFLIVNGTHAAYGCSGGTICNGGTITYRVYAGQEEIGMKTVEIVQ